MTTVYFDILKKITASGFRAYAVGSFVCDYLLEKTPSVCHIVTSADFRELKSIFKNIRITNGIINIIEGGVSVSVETAIAMECQDNSDLMEYLSREEYTIFSLAITGNGEILDFFGGEEDVRYGIIRPVGDASVIFKLSPEIMLDIVFQAAQYCLSLPDDIKTEIKLKAPLIKTVNRQYVLSKLNAILVSRNPEYIRVLHEVNLLKYLIPQLEKCFGEPQRNKYHIYDVGEHIIHTVENTRCDDVLRWAALFHDIGKPVCPSTDSNGIIHFYGHHKESAAIASETLHKYHMPQEKISDILTLIEYHDVRIENNIPAVKRMLSKLDSELFFKLIELQIADNSAKNPIFIADKKAKLNETRRICEEIMAKGEPYRISDLAISSRDLINMKCKAGRKVGDTLRTLLDEVMYDPSLNNRKYLLSRAKQLISK